MDKPVTSDTSDRSDSRKPELARSIGLIGFFGIGLSAIFGTSWLLNTGIWMDRAGGPANATIAFVLCFAIELPLILAYVEAVPMIPLAGGELSYSYLAFGEFVGMIVGWFGVLVNIILCAWEALAIYRLVSFLFPALAEMSPLYEVLGSPITLPAIILGLALIIGVFIIQYRGAKISAMFGTIITLTVVSIALICSIIGLFHFDPANFQPSEVFLVGEHTGQTDARSIGILSLLAMLPFSIAGWESVAKGAREAAPGTDHSKIGWIIVLAVAIATIMYIITLIMPASLVPWMTLSESTAPFAAAMRTIGFPALGTVLIVAACLGVIGVYNAVFFAATRMLFTMAEYGLVPEFFARVHPKYQTPVNSIIFVSVISAIVLFLGQAMFIPLIDVAAVAYIILWGSTLASVFRLRQTMPDLKRPALYPGGKPLMIIGLTLAVILLCLLLIPVSPVAIIWPVEYLTLGALLLIGIVLYLMRDKSVTTEERNKAILGEIATELEI